MSSSSKPSSPIVTLALFGIVGIGYYFVADGVNKVTDAVKRLPVQGYVIKAGPSDAIRVPEAKGIHPLLIESSKKVGGPQEVTPAGGMRPLDTLFAHSAREEAKEGVKAEVGVPLLNLPQGLAGLKSSVSLQAVTNNGAIINGQFFSPGEKVTTVVYQSTYDRKVSSPWLTRVGKDSVVLRESKRGVGSVTVKLK